MKEKDMIGGCCVCSDERGWPDNPLVYCDGNGCTVAVHQACYGIVTVPTGPWYCRKCESPETKGKVRCELCPSKSGALKRTDTGGWAHVVCALYIPEVRFGNVTSMEPIVLRLIPPERYNKTCYICQESGKSHRATAGACMQCNKSGCRLYAHVTCAQRLGLLCEEAGNYQDNVKYCGYCQHHYSKLKKGGNVKTIPPYKPVSHDSQSSDSSCEKEGEASPMASGSGTPTHAAKSKGPGRKSTHTSNSVSGKSTPSSTKTPTNTSQPMETNQDSAEVPTVGRKHKAADKNKKKPSPSRRGSLAGDAGGSGSKSNTPAPSPQHTAPEHVQPPSGKGSGSSTPVSTAKVAPPSASPSSNKPIEAVGVISSVASVTATSVSTVTATPASTSATTSVVQAPSTKSANYQETVITNTDSMDTKQTKKRKAVSAANTPTVPVDYAATPPSQQPNDVNAQNNTSMWETPHIPNDTQMDAVDKIIKKAKTEQAGQENPPVSHFASMSPAPPPPPPPPAHSPASHPSPRHLPSPMPGPSGLNTMSNIRSPSQPQGVKGERDGPASLLVSVPLPSTSHGLNLSAHAQVSAPSELCGPSPHIFHQPQKQATMEPSVPAHSPHPVPGRSSWGGLNVGYEMQQDPNKPGVSGVAGPSKDVNVAVSMIPMPPATIRNKKRNAMATSVVAMANNPAPSAIQTATNQNLSNVRRPPQPTPPPIYQETIKDSPPSSPSSERPLKPKMESKIGVSCTAPHMLGNELNPESGAAARLQEQLSAELAAHAAGSAGVDPLVPPPLINKAAPNSSSSSGRGSSSGAQSLDQLLERQWEQGSQFLMEQAQHFDIASLLSCLHQLRTENVRLEEHVGNLLQRRDHLLAVNARLAIPLTTVSAGPPEPSRCTRENSSQVRPPPPPVRTSETITSERSHQLIMREVQQKPS
ncbi:protein AF-10 isoform X8 [Galleria mellonella]|uniref:Protein AF-10 isoform X8 n=1 Tax=Galleria mellonella TaxID=7137 RepID=A0ABM3MMV1_GALME|nr:protein AF-10 isoform X8 [Galleria mellonella]